MDKKYKIEGNIDFFSELYKSLDEDDSTGEDDNRCLITNEPLTDRYIKMKCGHSFNYLPLLNDIKNHKEKFNHLEGSHTKLKQDEIRCPYCRSRQTEVLPYYEDLYSSKIHGVNCIIPFLNYYPNYSTYKPPNSFIGNCCFNMESNHNYYCPANNVYNFEDGKTYCYTHSKIMTTKMLKDAELKKKELAKQAKLKEKEDAKQVKLKEKEDAKLAKLKEKEEKKKNKKNTIINLLDEKGEQEEQNEIICQVIDLTQTDVSGCIEILKYGSNKGNKCCKGIYNNNLCKRHFDKLNKETI
jgi:DNA-directed RNA polymerase subunit RPC12/RpoP